MTDWTETSPRTFCSKIIMSLVLLFANFSLWGYQEVNNINALWCHHYTNFSIVRKRTPS